MLINSLLFFAAQVYVKKAQFSHYTPGGLYFKLYANVIERKNDHVFEATDTHGELYDKKNKIYFEGTDLYYDTKKNIVDLVNNVKIWTNQLKIYSNIVSLNTKTYDIHANQKVEASYHTLLFNAEKLFYHHKERLLFFDEGVIITVQQE